MRGATVCLAEEKGATVTCGVNAKIRRSEHLSVSLTLNRLVVLGVTPLTGDV